LIISCEQCRAQFRLDDSKIPEGGARVRCSKCNHAFFIAPPGQSDDLEAENLAREALERGRPSEVDEPESDWEFNEDAAPSPPSPPPGLRAARDAVDDLLGDLARSVPVGPGAETSELAEPSAAEPELQRDDGAELSEPEPEAAEPPPGPELGSPEGWNFFDDSDDAEPAAGEAIGQLALTPRWRLLEQEREEAERVIEARAAAADLDDAGSPTLWRWLGRLGTGAGWVASLALLAAGAWAVASGPTPLAAPAVLDVGGFRAEELHGRWVENALGGSLFVVSGQLRPLPGSTHPVEGPLVVRLLDAAGKPLASATTPVGPPFPERVLRGRDPRELRAAQARAAAQFARLHPGESAPFEALFGEVPPAAARFALERVPR
jgi:predicted Zn finger-like uncharacterized protein